jgi:ABC-2 type transport system ATP-binding protein
MARVVTAAETAPTAYGWEVRATGLRVRAGRRYAVDGLDLRLGPGVHGLLGPNGAGKTTLVRALATVLAPAAGELELLGVPARGSARLREVRRRIGYLPQEFGYYRRFTVREFVAYLAWLKEVPGADVPAAVQRAVDRVGLADRADARLRTRSGGMLRRAGIAQAIVNDPTVLLLDEPTAGLDPEQRVRFRELVRGLGEDTCVVVSTHLVEDVAAACDSVLLMDDGRLAFRGSAAELAAAGADKDPGTSPSERGYAALLERHRRSR